MIRLLQLFFLLLLSEAVLGQSQPRVVAKASLERNSIRIGEQINVKFSVRYLEGTAKTVVKWPAFKDTLAPGIEIISKDTLHTELRDKSSVLYEQWQYITITAFAEGNYPIPAKVFEVDGKFYATPPLVLTVNTVQVDTTQPIKDIKEIYQAPAAILKEKTSWFKWWMAIAAGAIVVLTLVILWLTRKKTKPAEVITAPVPDKEPHERVLEELAQLRGRRLWEQPEELKNYHIRLTEILRGWVVERYRIGALEMTTGEILQHMRYKQADESAVMLLRDVLLMADAVKFAKYTPPAEENERSISTAETFVEKTQFPAPIQVQSSTTEQR